MAIERWSPSRTFTRQEQFIMKRLKRTRKLFAFLREVRHELFDDAFQAELETMYRDTGAGKPPLPPAVLAMALLLQAYLGVSDAEAVELTMLDLRWQMVLGCLGRTEPLFSQGALCDFRHRLIRHELDRRLLERTVELAKRTEGFDWKKLPKDLRVAIDSSPLEGAGRVEDTVNLLAHAGRKIVDCVAGLLGWSSARVCKQAGIPLLAQSSIKRALDYTWSDPEDKAAAITFLVGQLTLLEHWVQARLPEELARPPLKEHIETLHELMHQDLEPDPSGGGGDGGGVRVREGVAPDRRVSVEDKEMRHGRKSKSKRFNGYKRHLARDLDSGLILACAMTPANRPEEEAAASLEADLARLPRQIRELYIDRGYINAPLVDHVLAAGGEIICRPWAAKNGKLFAKPRFDINVRDRTITCPAGHTEHIAFGTTVEFDPEHCDSCLLRKQCTDTSLGHGRTVSIADNEPLQKRLRKLAATPAGRARLRLRVPVEHGLAQAGRRQGRRARYRGCRKNLYDWRRAAAITNLEAIQREVPRDLQDRAMRKAS
ncbi:MAG TPA: IS1182 family transposase [Polyangia bacterium]